MFKRLVNRTKFWVFAALFSLVPAAMAEGESGSGPATLQSISDDIVSSIESAVPIVLGAIGAVIAAVIGFWGVRALVRAARSYFAGRG